MANEESSPCVASCSAEKRERRHAETPCMLRATLAAAAEVASFSEENDDRAFRTAPGCSLHDAVLIVSERDYRVRAGRSG